MELLKLVALDTDDLEVVSAHLQDAVVCVGDVHWRPNENRLVIGLARFDWEGVQANRPEFERRSTALRFDRVNSFKCRGVNCSDKKAMLNLLARLRREEHPGRLLLQIHDELVLEAPEDRIEDLGRLVREEMENAMQLAVPLKVDLSAGSDWLNTEGTGE